MANKIKAAMVLPSFAIGGAQRMVCELIRSMDLDRFLIKVICFAGYAENSFLEKKVEAAGVEVSYGVGGGGIHGACFVAKELSSFKPDLVHAHLGGAQLSMPWCITKRIPLVVTLHTTMPLALHPAVERAARLLRKDEHAFFFVAVSEETQKQAEEYFGSGALDVRMIPNGVVLSDFQRRLEAEYPVFINVGTQNENKNQEMIIDAFSKVKDKVPGSRLILIGDGPLHDELIERASRCGSVKLVGTTDDVPFWLSHANVYVQSSYREAMPMSIIEAMASAMPVISTDVGGIRSLVEEGGNGFVVPAGSVDELYDAMLKLADRRVRESMGDVSGQESVKFSANVMARSYESVYREACGVSFPDAKESKVERQCPR